MNRELQPPRLASNLLERLANKDIRYSAIGDFEEIYISIARDESVFKAYCWYWRQVIKSFPTFLFDTIFWSIFMLFSI